jgi:crossover junction endodeoxyribonuclease RuvC
MFVLGIDPGLSTTGYGLIAAHGLRLEAVAAGAIRTSPAKEAAERLAELFADLEALLAEYHPDEMALEQVFVNRNLLTATAVGRAVGVTLLAGGRAGIPVFEYTPSAVKMAVTGSGNAAKDRVQALVARRLRLTAAPRPADAADALAVALCHLQSAGLRRAAAGAGR